MAYGGHGDFGASQFAGAGFIQSQANTVEGAYGSGSTSTRKTQNSEQTLRTVTIRQLLKDNVHANDGGFTVDGVDINTVTLLGRITKLDDKNSMQTQLVLDDGTCSADIVSFTDDSASQQNPHGERQHEWRVGSYVRVVGNLRNFQQKLSVQAYSIRPVHDHNEIVYHQLQCIFQHVHLTKGAPPSAAAGGNAAGAYAAKGGVAAPAYGAPAGGAGAPSLNESVLAFYRAPENSHRESGIKMDEAEAALRAQGVPVTRQALALACEALCNEGLMYTTVDESTFRCT